MIFLSNKDKEKRKILDITFINCLLTIEDFIIKNVYKKFLKYNNLLKNNNYDFNLICKLIPDICLLNAKFFSAFRKTKFFNFLLLARSTKLTKIDNEDYQGYAIYLIQRKLGLINHSVPGAEQIEKELGIKPFN